MNTLVTSGTFQFIPEHTKSGAGTQALNRDVNALMDPKMDNAGGEMSNGSIWTLIQKNITNQ